MKTIVSVVCSGSNQPITNQPALVLRGEIMKFDPSAKDGIGDPVIVSEGDGSAFLTKEFLKLFHTVKKARAPRGTASAVTLDDVMSAIRKANAPVTAAALATAMSKSDRAVRAHLQAAHESGLVSKSGKAYVAVQAAA